MSFFASTCLLSGRLRSPIERDCRDSPALSRHRPTSTTRVEEEEKNNICAYTQFSVVIFFSFYWKITLFLKNIYIFYDSFTVGHYCTREITFFVPQLPKVQQRKKEENGIFIGHFLARFNQSHIRFLFFERAIFSSNPELLNNPVIFHKGSLKIDYVIIAQEKTNVFSPSPTRVWFSHFFR